MFDNLSDKLQAIFDKLAGKGRLKEPDVVEAMREIRLALLEADVNFRVVKDFVNKVKEKAVGDEILESLTPAQHVVKIVRDELVELLGGSSQDINWSPTPPTVFLMCGLQGCGKTTTTAKLAKYLMKSGKSVMLAACDVQRPAAIKQLEVLGDQIKTPVYSNHDAADPVQIAKSAYEAAKAQNIDVLIIDTAGRLQIDSALMQELSNIKKAVPPHEILLVVDATTGQESVNVAQSFHEQMNITGIILTKMDSDTRGGAALSLRAVMGKPVRFTGIGEKTDALELFHPDRIAGRILGMGDVLSLIEKAEQTLDMEQAQDIERKLRERSFDFNDFLSQMQQVRSMGPLDQLMGLIPGMNKLKASVEQMPNEKHLKRIEAMIYSMTPKERENPELLSGSRRKRIADGSGVTVQELNKMVKEFMQMREVMQMMLGGGRGGKKAKKIMKMIRGMQ